MNAERQAVTRVAARRNSNGTFVGPSKLFFLGKVAHGGVAQCSSRRIEVVVVSPALFEAAAQDQQACVLACAERVRHVRTRAPTEVIWLVVVAFVFAVKRPVGATQVLLLCLKVHVGKHPADQARCQRPACAGCLRLASPALVSSAVRPGFKAAPMRARRAARFIGRMWAMIVVNHARCGSLSMSSAAEPRG